MPLTIVTGRANSGKTGRAYGVVRAALESGSEAVLLLPSAADVTRARRELSRGGAIGLRITQFDRYLEDLWGIHGDGRRFVTEAQRVLLLTAVVERGATDTPLEEIARTPGLVRMLTAVVRRYPAAGTAERNSSTMRTELVRMLDDYREALRRAGLVDPAEAFRVLAATAPPLQGPLVAHRFTDFTPEQEAFLLAQSAAGTSVCVTLPHARDFVPTAAVDGAMERLARSGEVVELPVDASYTPSAELSRAEALLFAEPRPAEGGGDVRLVLASGQEGEAAGIVAEILLLLAEGVRPERIAVAFRDPLRHRAWIGRALAAAGIAADFDMRVPLGQVPLGRALLHLLRFFAGGYRRRDLTAFLRSAASGADPAATDAAEAQWRSRRLEEGRELVGETKGCGRSVRGVFTVASRLADRGVEPSTLRDWQWLLDTLLSTAHPRVSPAGGELALDAAVHRVVLETLDGMAELGGARFADAVAVLRDLAVTPAEVERVGHVQVVDAERARFRRFDAMIIGGLTASEFPRQGGGDGFGSEAVAAAGRLLGLEPTQGSDLDRERLLLYQLVTRAKRRLVLVRQETDSEGRPQRSSVFWDEFLDLYRCPSGDDTATLPESVPVNRATTGGVAAARADTPPRPRLGRIEDEAVLEALAAREVFSASDIEAYLRCPYRWFYERELRPASLDPELDPRATGTLVHEALRLFYEQLEGVTGSPRVTPELLAPALDLADAAFAEAAAHAPEPRDLVEEERVHKARRWARGLVRRDARFLEGWVPTALEWSFGRRDEPEEFEGFRLKGTVDRIDRGPGGLVVMDYKSSPEVPKRADFAGGIVQIPLYVEVARRRFGERVVAGLYRSLSSPLRSERGFYLGGALPDTDLTRTDACEDAGVFEAVVRAAELTAAEAVAGMRAGAVAQQPRDERECVHCTARHGCGGRRS